MLMIVFATCVNAQEYAFSGNKVLDNTYFGIGIGASAPLGNIDFPLNTFATVKVGKNFDPYFGVELEGAGWAGSISKSGHFTLNTGNFVRATNVGVNGTINLTNLIFGYKHRVVELTTVTGLGWLHEFNADVSDANSNYLSSKTGLNLAFNIGNASQIVFCPAIYWNLSAGGNNFESIKFNKNYAQLSLSVGYIYKFKTSNGTHSFKRYNITKMNDEINALRLANDSLSNLPAKTITIIKPIVTTHMVCFAKNSAALTDEAKEILDNVVGPVSITATASPEGTAEYNKALSEERAQVVSEYLTNKGITVTSTKGLGVVNDASNRIATITIK